MSTFRNDSTTDIILDFIAEHESQGNYNALIGNAKSTLDLSQYTLSGILYKVMPWNLVRHPRLRSTATGRYQFLRGTLADLMKALNLKGSERFTPELQDRLAVQLLVRRRYREWWRSAISDVQFAHELSKEWASLPDPFNNGRSHYDGDGVNHAGTTLPRVYGVLRRAREARVIVRLAGDDPGDSQA